MKVSEIAANLRRWAPEASQEEWDNTGFQLRLLDREVSDVVVAMDVTEDVVELAVETDAQLILTHHPMFFQSLKHIDIEETKGRMVARLIQNNISVYASHTAMDKAKGGVNDLWIDKLGLNAVATLTEEGIGIVGDREIELADILQIFQNEEIPSVRAYGRGKTQFQRIAFVGGSGADCIDDAVSKGSDLLITGDVKHHDGQHAYEQGLMVIDIGHFHSEKAVLAAMAQWIESLGEIRAHLVVNSPFAFEISGKMW
ncbi:dinuclear metal center YbgI/SA1388 family protein [Peptoniphilus ivorii]|uniref:Nif3-like dinuclear metal center hexameric protein n=1 Tax=Aedoeadaptatus ivorii TaxID=54006 RepID=UPI0027896BFD|nr:Nif3-like dinuclear metal center hexameric protein [Peptoniphilus ivorii]MDQ0507617.1 dinuclear metal center YbgI/SA1388 family protein [Peptoniphilus ivorii]